MYLCAGPFLEKKGVGRKFNQKGKVERSGGGRGTLNTPHKKKT